MKIVTLLLISLRLFGVSWSVVCVKLDGAAITAEMVRTVYFKTMTRFEGHAVHPLNLPASHPVRIAFMQRVLKVDSQTWDAYYDELHFEGISAPQVVSSAAAMQRFVLKVDGAIGYVPSANVKPPMIEIIRFEE